MYRLVYLSQSARDFSPSELAQLVDKSQRNNAKVHVTGMLVYHQRRFFQVLEGPEVGVADRFNRIRVDPRHGNLSILSSAKVKDRAFPSWRMALHEPDVLPVAAKNAVFSICDLLPMNSDERGEDDVTRRLVRDFLASFKRIEA